MASIVTKWVEARKEAEKRPTWSPAAGMPVLAYVTNEGHIALTVSRLTVNNAHSLGMWLVETCKLNGSIDEILLSRTELIERNVDPRKELENARSVINCLRRDNEKAKEQLRRQLGKRKAKK